MTTLKLRNFFIITIGAAIMGFGINNFNIANNLAEGGVAGIAILLKLKFGFDPGLTTMLINIPLLILGWKVLGRNSLIYTVFGTGCLSVFLSVFGMFRLPLDDILLASLFAGVTVGIGMGIIFRVGGTTGGVDIIARVFQKYFGWKIGRTMFVADLLIVITSLLYFSVEQAMYTIVVVYVGTRVVDFVQEMAYSMRAAHIISEKCPEIARKIMGEMNRGVTLLHGQGGYSGRERDVVYVVVGRSEIVKLKNLILDIDPDAFIAISEAGDVIGQGFSAER